jgi:hypothetical protein
MHGMGGEEPIAAWFLFGGDRYVVLAPEKLLLYAHS